MWDERCNLGVYDMCGWTVTTIVCLVQFFRWIFGGFLWYCEVLNEFLVDFGGVWDFKNILGLKLIFLIGFPTIFDFKSGYKFQNFLSGMKFQLLFSRF